jgi:hypothetical protein
MSASNDTNHLRRAAEGDSTTLQLDPERPSPPNKLRPVNHLPERYSIKSSAEESVLICLEAPNLNIHIERGFSVTGSIARKSPNGTIFLDGVAQCEPFMDHERQVYNFDHHEGCVRAFTLSSCEQTLVMYMKGLDLQGREWNIFANEPDLDTILAIWILLNHARIGGMGDSQRRILFALVRYEGVIDSLGLELKELIALPSELMRKIQRVIDHLRSEELRLKKEGRWPETDFLTYTALILHKIDQIFYKASDFADYKGIEELARIDLNDQRIAAVVEADMGIYEIEPHLTKLYGNRLGVVFLKKGPNTYTVRQMDLFMSKTLDDIYERLNFVDPAVKYRTQFNKWGGANDIGGSPRESGTALQPVEIARACRAAVRKAGIGQQTARFSTSAALAILIVLCAHIVKMNWNPTAWLGIGMKTAFWANSDFGFIMTLFVATGASLLFIAYCQPWQYGWIFPTGNTWWWLLPAAVVTALAGGVWIPGALSSSGEPLPVVIAVTIGAPVAVELLFRCLVHGLTAQTARIQRYDSRWFLSWPTIASTLLYTIFVIALQLSSVSSIAAIPVWHIGIALAGAALFGLTLSMVRERSHSLFPAVLFHLIALCAVMVIARLW